MKYFSFGGGVQSTGGLVLAAWCKLIRWAIAAKELEFAESLWAAIAHLMPTLTMDQFLELFNFDQFIFSNVGNDTESPHTINYTRDYSAPFAAGFDLPIISVWATRRDGSAAETLYQRLMRPESRSLPIPVRMNRTGAPGTRSCTADYKIRVIEKYLKSQGATKQTPAITGLGISLDEFQRMRKNRPGESVQHLVYPLIEARLTRGDCIRIIQFAGLPVPPKSSCWFCPFHSRKAWQEMHDQDPDLFAKAVELEHVLNERRVKLGRDPVWLTSALIPLDQVVKGNQTSIDMDSNCESGYCHT